MRYRFEKSALFSPDFTLRCACFRAHNSRLAHRGNGHVLVAPARSWAELMRAVRHWKFSKSRRSHLLRSQVETLNARSATIEIPLEISHSCATRPIWRKLRSDSGPPLGKQSRSSCRSSRLAQQLNRIERPIGARALLGRPARCESQVATNQAQP